MAKAVWNGTVVAESDTCQTVEGNVYFPPEGIKREYFKESDTTSRCPWKGLAHYYTLVIEGAENADAAWYYPEPSKAASRIKDHVAFWRGVKVDL